MIGWIKRTAKLSPIRFLLICIVLQNVLLSLAVLVLYFKVDLEFNQLRMLLP
jgi:hypothetical protein